jgi:hypothetical protein
MTGIRCYTTVTIHSTYTVLDMRDCYTCSFTEFYPFCPKLYYFSNFKDFNTLAPACH